VPEVRPQPLPEDLLTGKRIAVALATALALGWPGGLVAQESPAVGRIEVVLDASADMLESIGGVARISLAREFLDALHGGLSADGSGPPALRLYGSASPRARRDCSDSRLVVPPGATLPAWTAALAAIQPRGVSPLAHALRQAALDSVPTYVLVTDGGDDCRADPCAVWKEVVGGGPNRRSRLHVVALDPGVDRLEELRCLSRAGSGSLTVIDGAGEAGSAGERVARILRNEGMIDVRTALGEGGERVSLPARVMRPVPNEMVAAFTTRAPRTVPAGVYRIVIEASPPITFERVLVLPGEITTLDATELGRLRVELLDDRGTRIRAPVSIRSADGRRELRYGVTGEDAVMQAGSYGISVELGDSVLEARDVTVTAGRTTRYAFGGGGTLLVLSPEFETPPPTVVRAFRGGAVDTLRVGEPYPLPAGTYRLVVETLPMYVTEDVTVRDESQTVVTLPETGILGVSLSGMDGVVTDVGVDVLEVLTGEVYGTILSGERHLAMPARYDLVARTVPPATISGVDVTPGQERIVRREGLSRVSVVPAPGVAGPYRLELFAPAGDRRLGEATGPQPALAAWPGEYLARVWRGRELLRESRVAVASDKTARIDLASP
jgi:hypothetical protein